MYSAGDEGLDAVVGDCVEVVIADTGQGMDPETLERVFEPYFTTKARAGDGLGLSVVRLEPWRRPGARSRSSSARPW